MTTLVRRGKIEKPCRICGKRDTWILRYVSGEFDQYISVCVGCRRATGIAEKEAFLVQIVGLSMPGSGLTTPGHG